MLKVAVLVSGGGTNLQAIIDSIADGRITNAQIVTVISNNKNAYALERAGKAGIPAKCVSPGDYENREAYYDALLLALESSGAELVVLAGCMVIMPEKIVKRYENRIINIHPALIPSFCGKDYYGLRVHEGVLKRGVKVTGATVHFVDQGTDTGPIILQKAVSVLPGDTPKTLQRRVMEEAEWVIMPKAIDLIANGKIRVEDGIVTASDRTADAELKNSIGPNGAPEGFYDAEAAENSSRSGGEESGRCGTEIRRHFMRILIVGGGGREHAIAWKIAQSPKVEKIYCAPGNAGIGEYAECVDIGVMEFERLATFAKEKAVDLAVIGMDDPLVGGIVDVFEAEGIRVFGPRKNAAVLEGSKAFSKDLMKKYGIPTAEYENFDDPQKALAYLEHASFPIVLKADGLALGKGVLICNTPEEAREGVRSIMMDKKFGTAGNQMVIEEFMTGREVSVLSFVDGKNIKTMTSAQDHKRALDGDQGLNTGGMGTFSPSPFYTDEVDAFCRQYIYQKTVDAMAAEGREFRGIIFFGLMLTEKGPKVLEFNARFGDPETQVVLPRMKNDIVEVFEACIDGTLDQIDLEFENNAAVCVVLASEGYPVSYEKGFEIRGLEAFREKEGYYVFHAASKLQDGKYVTNGGRVLGVTATGADLKEARANAYEAVKWVDFDNKYCRSDIGKAIDEI